MLTFHLFQIYSGLLSRIHPICQVMGLINTHGLLIWKVLWRLFRTTVPLAARTHACCRPCGCRTLCVCARPVPPSPLKINLCFCFLFSTFDQEHQGISTNVSIILRNLIWGLPVRREVLPVPQRPHIFSTIKNPILRTFIFSSFWGSLPSLLVVHLGGLNQKRWTRLS